MANRFVLNETSYHEKGVINEISNEAKARGFTITLLMSYIYSLVYGMFSPSPVTIIQSIVY